MKSDIIFWKVFVFIGNWKYSTIYYIYRRLGAFHTFVYASTTHQHVKFYTFSQRCQKTWNRTNLIAIRRVSRSEPNPNKNVIVLKNFLVRQKKSIYSRICRIRYSFVVVAWWHREMHVEVEGDQWVLREADDENIQLLNGWLEELPKAIGNSQ